MANNQQEHSIIIRIDENERKPQFSTDTSAIEDDSNKPINKQASRKKREIKP
jgi:hypothetical protein